MLYPPTSLQTKKGVDYDMFKEEYPYSGGRRPVNYFYQKTKKFVSNKSLRQGQVKKKALKVV